MKFKDKIEDGIGILTLKGKLMGYPETDGRTRDPAATPRSLLAANRR